MITVDLSGRSQSQTCLVCRVEAEMASSGFCDTGLVGRSDEWAGHLFHLDLVLPRLGIVVEGIMGCLR